MSDLVLQTYLSLIQTSRSDSPNNRMGSALSRSLRITYQNTSSIRILDIYTASYPFSGNEPRNEAIWPLDPSGTVRKGLLVIWGRVWGITLLRSVELEWHNFRENPISPPEEIFAVLIFSSSASVSYWPHPFIVAGLTEDERSPMRDGRTSSAGLN